LGNHPVWPVGLQARGRCTFRARSTPRNPKAARSWWLKPVAFTSAGL